MKRMLSLILALVLCLSLCACGKSDAAKAADELILAIGEVSVDSEDAVKAAEEAYNALSDKDKEDVEYHSTLVKARTDLDAALKEKEIADMEEGFADLTERLEALNKQCEAVTDFVYMVWSNVGPQNFFTHFNAILMFEDEGSLDAMKEYHAKQSSGQNRWITAVWAAGMAIDEAKYGDVGLGDNAMINEIVETCVAFTSVYNSLSETDQKLSDDISSFVKAYKNDFAAETDILREWNLESSMYVEFALNPDGTLNSYGEKMGEYQNTMSRFQKEANSLK